MRLKIIIYTTPLENPALKGGDEAGFSIQLSGPLGKPLKAYSRGGLHFFAWLFMVMLALCNIISVFAQEQAEELKIENLEYTALKMRDPFTHYLPLEKKADIKSPKKEGTSGATEEKSLPAFSVKGIIWGGKFPQALINDKVLKIGDEIVEGAKITRIDKEGISVLYYEREYRIAAPASASNDTIKGGKK